MRRTLSAADAKNRLADALRQAESGDLVLITRYRKPVAALVGGERLERLERLEEAPAEAAAEGEAAGAPAPPAVPAPAAPTLRELRDRAAAGSLRRIEVDLARMPERLKPTLRLIRANLFHPRINAERLQAALLVGAHDFTSEFGRATAAGVRRPGADLRSLRPPAGTRACRDPRARRGRLRAGEIRHRSRRLRGRNKRLPPSGEAAVVFDRRPARLPASDDGRRRIRDARRHGWQQT